MKYIDADLLRKEIEKGTPNNLQLLVYRDIVLSLIDSLQREQQEEPDKSLEEAAAEFAEGEWDGVAVDTDGNPLYSQDEIEYTFKAGAEWQASQMPMPEDTVLFNNGVAEGRRLMMEEAVEGTVNQDGIMELSNGEAVDLSPSLDKIAFGLQPRQKVRIIVLKEEEEI